MKAKLMITVFGLALVLSAVGCGENITGTGGNGGSGGSGGSGGGGGGGGSTPGAAVHFPLHPGSQWIYEAELSRSNGSTYAGQFTARLVSFDSTTRVGKLSIEGDRHYDNGERIPQAVYLRDAADGLERSDNSWGPWKKVYSTTTGSWGDGGFIFAGTPNYTFQRSTNSVSVPAGTFNSVYVKAHYDNHGQQYAMEIYENDWAENIDPNLGLLKCRTYSYYHNRDPQWPLPSSSTFTVRLVGYAIAMPDGSTVTGGTGAQVDLTATLVPQTQDYELIEGILYRVRQNNVPISLSFSKAMDRSSVEDIFLVNYWEGATLRTLDGSFTWESDAQALWTPSRPYTSDAIYMAQLEVSAMTPDGEMLSERAEIHILYEP